MFIAQRNPNAGAPWRETRTLDSAMPDIRNVDAVLGLLEYRALEFTDGRKFRVPPISGFDGAKVLDLLQRIAQVGDDVDAHLEAYTDLSAVAKRLLIPSGWRRWLWKLHIRPNPLRDRTMREMAWVAGFLFRCAMSGPNRMSAADEPNRVTSSKTSARTGKGTRRSSTNTVFR